LFVCPAWSAVLSEQVQRFRVTGLRWLGQIRAAPLPEGAYSFGRAGTAFKDNEVEEKS
jgi:hypothetical protein